MQLFMLKGILGLNDIIIFVCRDYTVYRNYSADFIY